MEFADKRDHASHASHAPKTPRADALSVCERNLWLLKERQAELKAEFSAIAVETARALLDGSGNMQDDGTDRLRQASRALPADADVRAVFCRAIAEGRREWAEIRSYIPENDVPKSPLVAYFRNSTSNLAFSRFEKIIPELRAAYFDDFSQICEETAAGRCDLCMLPVYDAQNGTLRSVRRLIERYDLHRIASVWLPVRQDSEEKVEFALFCPEFRRLPEAKILSLGAVFENEGELSAFLQGTHALGAVCTFCDRLPPDTFEEIAYDLDFDLGSVDTAAICLYLDLFYPRVSGKGVYVRLL